MVNVELLKKEIEEQNIDVDEIIKALDIDRSTGYRKLDKPSTFKIGDIDALKKLLRLSLVKAVAIFLNENSQ